MGFAQWGTNVALADSTSSAGGDTGTARNAFSSSVKVGSPIDRSVIYYKGITFVGNATGAVDHARKMITGITNGSSNLTTTSTTASAATDGSAGVSATTSIVNNGSTSLNCNTEFTATINQTAPILKFNGTGELSVANQSLTNSLSGALQALIALIPTATDAATIAAINLAITSILSNTWGTDAAGNPDGTSVPAVVTLQGISDNSDTVSMHVFGSRIFQSSSR